MWPKQSNDAGSTVCLQSFFRPEIHRNASLQIPFYSLFIFRWHFRSNFVFVLGQQFEKVWIVDAILFPIYSDRFNYTYALILSAQLFIIVWVCVCALFHSLLFFIIIILLVVCIVQCHLNSPKNITNQKLLDAVMINSHINENPPQHTVEISRTK